MWKQLVIRVIPSAVLLGVAATAIQVTTVVHQVQAVQMAAQARVAHQAQAETRAKESVELREDAEKTQLKAQRDAALQQAADKDAALAEKDKRIKDLEQQVALKAYMLTARPSPGYATPMGAHWVYCGGPVSGFPCGYCTWWVATQRAVTWSGNAIDWWWNANRPKGQVPQVGAIMVTRESWFGHVAYVVAVNGSSWTVSEENFVGWGIVSYRTLSPGQAPVVGYIY